MGGANPPLPLSFPWYILNNRINLLLPFNRLLQPLELYEALESLIVFCRKEFPLNTHVSTKTLDSYEPPSQGV